MKRLAPIIIGAIALAGFSVTHADDGPQENKTELAGVEDDDADNVEVDDAEAEGPETDATEAIVLGTDAPESEVAEPNTLEGPHDPLVFRWFDIMGVAHETTDASIIPPGSNFEVKGGLLKKNELQRRRSWWNARKNRLQAELRGAHDELRGAKLAHRAAVRKNEPGPRLAELAAKVATWKSIVAQRNRDIKALRAQAIKAKIPQRWLKD